MIDRRQAAHGTPDQSGARRRRLARGRRAPRIVGLAGVVIALLLAACDRVDPASLPAVPSLQTSRFPPQVREQLEAAFAAVEQRPVSARRNGELAMMLQTYRQFPVAEIMYRRTRAIEPDEFRWAYLHGLVLSAVGQLEAAERAYVRAIELDGDFPLVRVRRAELLSDLGRVEEAATAYAQVMPLVPDVSEARFSFGRFLLAQGEPEQAIDEIRAAMRLSGPFGAAHYQLALAYRSLGQTEVADQNFRLAEQRRTQPADGSDPYVNALLPLNRNEQPFVQRAKTLAEAGRLDEARQFIELALERNPASVPAHVSLMGLATQLGDPELFERHRAIVMELDPDHPRVWYVVGLSRMAAERWEDAEAALVRSRDLDATDPNVHLQLAMLASRRGRPVAEQEAPLRMAIDIDPDHQLAAWMLGELLSDSRRAAEGVPLLRRAVVLEHPLRARMQVELARALARTGDGAGAHGALDEALADARRLGDREAIELIGRLRSAVIGEYGPRPVPGGADDASG